MKPKLMALAVIAALAVAGCSSSASSSSSSGSSTGSSSTAAEENPNLDLGSSLGSKPAPEINLLNQFGQPVALSQFRGHVVILAFSDSECTTVCPLTTESMVLAKELLGKARDSVQLLGVDANPDATKVSDVLSYSRVHGMVNEWDFLTGSLDQLESVWGAYNIAVQIQAGQIDHTPALYVISAQGILEKVYLTQMAYSSVTQSAQVLADEVAGLLPSHPKLTTVESLAAIPAQGPATTVALPLVHPAAWRGAGAAAGASTVTLGPGKPHLVVFFDTWLTEVSDLKAEMSGLNAYVKTAAKSGLPALTAVDETVTEPSAGAVTSFLGTLPPLDYPVALDKTGRLADGYGVQDQPWLVLVNAAGKITWSHDGWVPPATLEKAAKSA
jgi:protein SCO1/2